MEIVEPGHIYKLHSLDGGHSRDELVFVNREGETDHPGTQTQEVLRALIDRTMHCDGIMPWAGNEAIIHHLRMALVWHEARALIRKAEKGYYEPENVVVGFDGHFALGSHLPSDDAQAYNERSGRPIDPN